MSKFWKILLLVLLLFLLQFVLNNWIAWTN